MTTTPGQRLGLTQLQAIAAAANGGTVVIAWTAPTDSFSWLRVEVSLDCSHIARSPQGLQLRGRERFTIFVPQDFPYERPPLESRHARWAGAAHVQWGRWPCLYQAASEWAPHEGMYGFMARLDLWLTRAAAGQLDADDAPLHPPVQYGVANTLVTVSADCPHVGDTPWVGWADLRLHEGHADIVGWQEDPTADVAALAILLPQPLSWEYPDRVDTVLDAVTAQGVDPHRLHLMLEASSHLREEGTPMHVVVGTPMRRGHDGQPRQHVAVWQIDPTMADTLGKAMPRATDGPELSEARAELSDAVIKWARTSKLAWCPVSENRPEIVLRRDDRSPIPAAFAGKHIVIWGCGAIGAHIAEWIARAGARKITLYDKDIVTPGVLVRQPYTHEQIGKAKARCLADRLRDIVPTGLDVEAHTVNVFRTLSGPNWHEGADILIDATASAAVRLKLEEARQASPSATTTLVGMLFGHQAERGLAVTAPPGYSGGIEDLLRQAKVLSCSDAALADFAQEFWPSTPRTDHFQPEPGCSDTTFRGSTVEAAALAAGMLHTVAAQLTVAPQLAHVHFQTLPAVGHHGRREATVAVEPAAILRDGVGEYELRIAQSALAEIRGWTARNNRTVEAASETGGILLGRRDEATRTVWIDTVSGPPPDSIASRERFDCGTAGVAENVAEHRARSHGEIAYLGMWHTHPNMRATPSATDLRGMIGLVAGEELREAVMLIVGGQHGSEELAGYVFNGDEIRNSGHAEFLVAPQPSAAPPAELSGVRDIGLALSGGGSRALAFHLGCLRALRDRGLLPRIRVVSGVSGGSLMTALYAYGPTQFEDFDARVIELLRSGLQLAVVRRSLLSRRLPEDLAARLMAGTPSAAAGIATKIRGRRVTSPIPRWSSRTDAFADVLRNVLGDAPLDAPRRESGLDAVINACDLRSGTAFRFGSVMTSSSRYGRLTNPVDLATAVAASAAYPLLLPALDRRWTFEQRDGSTSEQRVALTDGGVYDNSATSCLRPGRSPEHTANIFPVDYVIACDAGRGQLAEKVPIHIGPRVNRAFEASFRKLQDASRAGLHEHEAHGELKGFVMPYLGQQDHRLPWAPPDLVPRAAVADYPTNFRAIDHKSLIALTTRGEQLTRLLIERWCPEL
jgi:integrative and conjugative element protein (TIGR02256 family)